MISKMKITDEIEKYKNEYIVILLFSFFLSLSSEIISRKGFILSIKWMLSNPVYFVISVMIVFTINVMISTIFFNHRISYAVSAGVVFSLSIINLMKYDLRGIPLIPSDIFLVNEVQNITNVINASKYTVYFIFIILSIILLTSILNRFIHKSFSIRLKIFNLIIGSIIISAVIFSNGLEEDNYLTKGFIVNYISKIDYTRPSYANADYDRGLLKSILKELSENRNHVGKANGENKEKPNIVIIMSEAFWDLNLLNVEVNPNPMEEFEKLKKESIYGRLEVPVFAGGTSNTEFEVLTGFSTHYFDDGYMLYTNEVKYPFISLASVLRKQGYYTTGIHPFWGWYYNRNQIYKHFGFDKFISDEYLLRAPLKGYYVSDEVVTDLVIEQIEDSDEPQFVFCVTMENHGPYDDDRFKNEKLDVEVKGNLDDESREILRTYSQGIYDANKALKRLIDYLKNDDEETILLFFGDHLPLLGENLKVYKECGYVNEGESYPDKHLKTMTTPFIIWSNYKDGSGNIDLIDSTFIGPYLLDKAGVELPSYYKYLLELHKEIKAINRTFAVDSFGNIIWSKEEKYSIINENLRTLQLAIMYRDDLIEDDLKNWIVENNESYNSCLNDMEIIDVTLNEGDLVIKGKNLYPKGTLFINDKKVDFDYIDESQIIVRDYKSNVNEDIAYVQYKLIDTIEKILAETNMYKYTSY